MRALGLMSGTSMDGVDAALIETDGVEIAAFGPTAFVDYTLEERDILRAALGLWPGDDRVDAAAEVVDRVHARALRTFESDNLEVIGFHGQTLAHDPAGRGTHQTGSGDTLVREYGGPVVWDFRTADVASGGEGAPLAPFFHFACAKRIGATGPVAFLNLGGVGNLTWVDPMAAAPEAPGALLAFDTGPGNALLDDFLRLRLDLSHDDGGEISARGQIDAAIIEDVRAHNYLSKKPPKSLDRLDFHWILDRVDHLSTEDGAATLAAVTAACIAEGARHFPQPVERIYVCGGGRRNRTILRMIQQGANIPVDPVEAVGLDGDMLEAQAFAYLAVRVLRGLATSAPGTTGARLPVSGGRISLPE